LPVDEGRGPVGEEIGDRLPGVQGIRANAADDHGDDGLWHPDATTFPEFKRSIQWFGLDDIVTPISGKTVDVAETWDKDIGLLFIDAAYAYESVEADFLAWSPFVVRRGWVAFHDAGAPGPSQVIVKYTSNPEEWGGRNAYPPLSLQRL
jgi:hypothetical protein